MLLSILANTPRHPDLRGITSIGGVAIVDAPTPGADLLALASDGAQLAIRYMSPAYLLHSIRLRTLASDVLKLRERTPWAYLVIGGVLTPNADGKARVGDTVSGWSWANVQGALLSAQESGVQVYHAQHAQHVPALIETLAKRERTPKQIAPPRDLLWCTPAMLMLMAIDGIGETLAEAVLHHCNNDVALALVALTHDELVIPGIGPKTRASARAALGLQPDESLGAHLAAWIAAARAQPEQQAV